MNKPALEFKGAIEGYVMRHLAQNFWKVARLMERDDVLQEAYLAYLQVCRNYPDVTDAPHFMSLFKRVWHCRFTDLTNKDTKAKAIVSEGYCVVGEEEPEPFDAVGSLDNDGYFSVVCEQAPCEVLSVVNLLLTAPSEFVDSLRIQAGMRGKRRLEANARINKALGLPLQRDSLGAVESYFANS